MGFPKDFLWGAASASAQVEGAWNEDGKCPSIWDVAGKHIKNSETCHVACDHYHRYKEDAALMKDIGLNSYRFSISWCRIMPEEGKINPKGIQFYKNLIAELKANGIIPLVTLYHWDLPIWLQKQGGWECKKIVDLYCQYVQACVDAFSEDVQWWMTFNEPTCFIILGNLMGMQAPFKHRIFTFKKQLRNMLLAHGEAVKLIRQRAKTPPKIGIVMAAGAYIPDGDTEADLEYARKMTFESSVGTTSNSLYMDPIVLKKPVSFLKGKLSKEDLDIISQPIDFIGINTYQPINPRVKKQDGTSYVNEKKSTMGWVIDARCLYWCVRFYHERYGLPVFVTENGIAVDDTVSEDGTVHDSLREEYIRDHLRELHKACAEGIPVLGYQHWSLTDNFEWAEGYGPRFGLIHIDYATQKRTVKDSAYYYKRIIESNGDLL